MIITILTLFPEIFPPVFNSSIIGRTQKKRLVTIRLVNIRDFAHDRHKSVDDRAYGGGAGMVMRVDVLERAISSVKGSDLKVVKGLTLKRKYKEKVILLDPKGKEFNQAKARNYVKLDHLILICGHYEGVDARISHFVDEKISIGNYVLTGGEIPAMIVTDVVTRLIPNVLTKKDATINESFSKTGYLEEPQFTRPAIYKGLRVPSVLLSGNHKKIDEWRKSKRKLLK